MSKSNDLSAVEGIKTRSRQLRGTIAEGLTDQITGAISDDDTQLIKFHGSYQQDDRDLRAERREQKLEPAWQFMVRARIPGGICTPAQWLAFDAIAHDYANGTLRLTTRQTFQLHGIVKRALKPTIAAINRALLDTLAACGDVNRNVMSTTLPAARALHAEALDVARRISEHLLPKSGAYHEIWLDGEKVVDTAEVDEPVYGRTYLPRKFKIGVAIPPDNDVDVYSQDLGFIAIVDAGQITGYNVVAGGGMGVTHGDLATWPRVADSLGVCSPAMAVAVAEAVVTTQRDHGDRTNRKHARLKYTIEDMGLEAFRAEVARRAGITFTAPPAIEFHDNGDRPQGWHEDDEGLWHYMLYVPSGRIKDDGDWRALTGTRAIAATGLAQFRLTANQNLLLSDITAQDQPTVDALLKAHGLITTVSPVRHLALACVGLPTCALAMAESERYAPDFLTLVEGLLDKHQLTGTPINLRITGCPNGCARPFLAEIALVGKAPGRYNFYLGGARDGSRLTVPYRDNITEAEILAELDTIFARYAAERTAGEAFGDYVRRAGIVASIQSGQEFSAEVRRLTSA